MYFSTLPFIWLPLLANQKLGFVVICKDAHSESQIIFHGCSDSVCLSFEMTDLAKFSYVIDYNLTKCTSQLLQFFYNLIFHLLIQLCEVSSVNAGPKYVNVQILWKCILITLTVLIF